MYFINDYLGHHHDKKVIYVLGSNQTINNFSYILKTNFFNELILIVEDSTIREQCKELVSSSNCVISNINNVIEEDNNFSSYTLIFDKVTNLISFFPLIKLRPAKLIAFVDDTFDSFGLWENTKPYIGEIIVSREINKYRNETLEWKKGESNIELSIVLPVYNVSKYLPKCLESLAKWDADYIEFLFINDGSTDNSLDVLNEYSKKDPRVKVITKENGGCASARQFGLERSKGRYVGFVDPDDFVEPTMFKKLLTKAFTGTYDIAYSKYYEYYEDTGKCKEVPDYTGDPYCFGTSDVKKIDELISSLRVAIWRCIYKKEFLLINSISFHTSLKRFDDLPFKVETFARAKSVVSVDEPLYYYRLGREGQDVSARDNRLYVHFDIFKILDEFFKTPSRSIQTKHYYIVKIQTHYWAIINIDKEYLKEYLSLAADDLKIKNTKHEWIKLFKRRFKGQELNKVKKVLKEAF